MLAGERWGIVSYIGVLIVSLIVQAIEEGTSVWTIFKAIASLLILAMVLALLVNERRPPLRRRVACWIVLAAIPWGINIVVEPALVFSVNAAAFFVPPHQAFHLLVTGGYSLATLILVAFLAARPLREGKTWGRFAILLAALVILAVDIIASAIVFTQPLHFVGHLLPPGIMLLGLVVARQ